MPSSREPRRSGTRPSAQQARRVATKARRRGNKEESELSSPHAQAGLSGAQLIQGSARRMIRLDNVSKQNGHQIVFIEASAALQKGEKVGLVGPNGSGKTTLFRLITGEDQPDEGQVAVDRGVTIGYFSQDVG